MKSSHGSNEEMKIDFDLDNEMPQVHNEVPKMSEDQVKSNRRKQKM